MRGSREKDKEEQWEEEGRYGGFGPVDKEKTVMEIHRSNSFLLFLFFLIEVYQFNGSIDGNTALH